MNYKIKKEILELIKKLNLDCEVEDFAAKVNWDLVSYQDISEDFIDYFNSKINWKIISSFVGLSEKFIEKYKDKVSWNYISTKRFSEEFIKKHYEHVNWDVIFLYGRYSEDLVEFFFNFVSKNMDSYHYNLALKRLSANVKFSDDFFDKHKDHFDWESVSMYREISIDFIKKYRDKIDIKSLIKNKKLIGSAKVKMNDYLKLDKQFREFFLNYLCS